MSKIIGNTTVTPVMPADWEQTDETKVDFIKNKPTKLSQFENDLGDVGGEDFATELVKHTNQEIKLGGYTEEEKKLPISTDVWDKTTTQIISDSDALSGRVDRLEAQVGDFDAALDTAIAICDSYIGGETE